MSQNVFSGRFDGVKVFSATKFLERDRLGETVTDWMRSNPGLSPVASIVTQSSDSEFHCLAITVFYVANGKTPQTR